MFWKGVCKNLDVGQFASFMCFESGPVIATLGLVCHEERPRLRYREGRDLTRTTLPQSGNVRHEPAAAAATTVTAGHRLIVALAEGTEGPRVQKLEWHARLQQSVTARWFVSPQINPRIFGDKQINPRYVEKSDEPPVLGVQKKSPPDVDLRYTHDFWGKTDKPPVCGKIR